MQPNWQNRLIVSIPYGKGKVIKEVIMDSSLRVSIPYGKGKVDAFVEVKNRGLGYQFPMGKVKVKNTIREYVTQ